MLQVVGGGFAGAAGNNVERRNIWTNMMISGIVWQLVTLTVFAGLVVDFFLPTRRAWNDVTPDKFRGFLGAVAAAF